MEPTKSYRIWFSQRNGSTVLCKGLEATGLLGKPEEHFFYFNHNSLQEKLEVHSYIELKKKLWELGTSSNGIFGIKHSKKNSVYNALFKEIVELRGMTYSKNLDEEAIWADIFPNCKHIFLTRRNKIRQAVSWWKAINDNIWQLERERENNRDQAFFEEKYNFDALSHLFKEISLRECAIQAYFSQYNIRPLTLVYEDFIQDFQGTIVKIADFLEVEVSTIPVVEKSHQKIANEFSEQWVQRFRKQIQGEGEQVW